MPKLKAPNKYEIKEIVNFAFYFISFVVISAHMIYVFHIHDNFVNRRLLSASGEYIFPHNNKGQIVFINEYEKFITHDSYLIIIALALMGFIVNKLIIINIK